VIPKTTFEPRLEAAYQALEFIEHVTVETADGREHKIRVTVHVDFYEHQSYGTVERWDGSRWEPMVRVNGESLTQHSRDALLLNVKSEFKTMLEMFHDDRQALLELTEQVLE
jgi:hypothetical protein